MTVEASPLIPVTSPEIGEILFAITQVPFPLVSYPLLAPLRLAIKPDSLQADLGILWIAPLLVAQPHSLVFVGLRLGPAKLL